jgi:transposase
MNEITTVGVDLAKNVIVVCAAGSAGQVTMFRQFSFRAFGEWAANLPVCVIGMEACGSAHYWARRLAGYGHTVKLIAAEMVMPFRKSKAAKNDRNDADAVLTALRQPNMRFVGVKSVESQAMLAWHRLRQGFNVERTALINRTRGLLAEFGIWLGRSPHALLRALPQLRTDERLPARFRPLIVHAEEHLRQLDSRIEECELEIRCHAKDSDEAQRVSAIVGIGPITASAIVSTVGRAQDFRNGRQLAAWLGLVPQQRSSGGKERLGAITKRGDTYLRGLLTHGARSTLRSAQARAPEQRSRLERWILELAQRVGYHKALTAVANKHARMIWAILAKGEDYDPTAWQRYERRQIP